ncbi:hypothetical protein [Micavibrio aeruginosavorus]|uniref:hypothetical protein n=1 Tax=Micavibrio aeruginosavorus TaxID=349221 RepID=UPI00059FD65D|nr:hypothetical protein [Micavibrio aeruginosavorus]
MSSSDKPKLFFQINEIMAATTSARTSPSTESIATFIASASDIYAKSMEAEKSGETFEQTLKKIVKRKLE